MSAWRSGIGPRPRAQGATRRPVDRPAGVDALLGVVRDVADLNERLAQLAGHANVVCPVESWGDIPDGHTVVLSRVRVDPNPRAGDVYSLGHRETDDGRLESVFGLSKVALLRVAQVAGVTVARNAEGHLANGRTDDGADPHLCSWTATVEAAGLFGARMPHVGDATIDLRDDAEAVRAIVEHSEEPERVLRDRREYIARAAQTAALLRAVRNALAVPLELGEREVARPFVVVVLRFDGNFADPEDRRAFRDAQIAGAAAASHALFGPAPVRFVSELASPRPSLAPGAGPAPLYRASASSAPPSRSPQPPLAGAAAAAPRPTSSQPEARPASAVEPAPVPVVGAGAPFGDEALVALALRKGRLGTADDQVTAVAITRLDGTDRQKLRARLEALPDAGAPPAPLAPPPLPPPQDTEPVPSPGALTEPTQPWGRWAPPSDEPIPF